MGGRFFCVVQIVVKVSGIESLVSSNIDYSSDKSHLELFQRSHLLLFQSGHQ